MLKISAQSEQLLPVGVKGLRLTMLKDQSIPQKMLQDYILLSTFSK
jgi:hypothetical protein